ncbi:GIN domain-containing protein [Maribacter spongiicola]|uniref:GIN domain-containing protein n=1 Tax=Maribacter spongiicola TaxID=1206753 RepID=UPI003F98DB13
MKRTICFVTMLCFFRVVAQDSKTFSTYMTLDDLKTIEIHDNLCVTLYPTYFNGLQVKGNRSLKDIIKWNYQNSTLKVFTVQENMFASSIEIILYVSEPKNIILSEKASIEANDKVISNNLTLYSLGDSTYDLIVDCSDFQLISDIAGTGNLSINAQNVKIDAKGTSAASMKIIADKVIVNQADKSMISIKGKAKSLSATIENKAKLSAWALLAKDVYLHTLNSEDTEVFAADRFKINGQGSGKIYVTGNPKQIDTILLNKRTKIIYGSK